MGLKDLLLQGQTSNNQSLEGNKGPQFAEYVNTAYAVGQEPGPPNVIGDTVAERGLTQDYNYTHGNSSATAGSVSSMTRSVKFSISGSIA